MIKIYTITSSYSEVVLAEVRTDGKKLDWIVDNTRGKLPSLSGNNWDTLKSTIENSSHLNISSPKETTVGLLRYFLESGDVVEITTDGKTAQLNGKIMSEAEKNGLMSAISSGKVKVKEKANTTQPMQIPSIQESQKELSAKKSPIQPELFKVPDDEKDEQDESYTRYNDPGIKKMKFEGSHSPEMGRQLLYLLKYGDDDER